MAAKKPVAKKAKTPAGRSGDDGVTMYRPGETVRCDSWNEDYTVECGGGIHFYITKPEAEAHQ